MKIKFTNNFDKLNKKISEINNTQVSFAELFNTGFMTRHTKYLSFEHLLEDGNFIVKSAEDFKAIPDDEFDRHINKNTKFESWEEMKSTAGQEYMAAQLKKAFR